MDISFFMALVIAVIVGLTLPKLMEKYKYGGRILIMLLLALSSMYYWKKGNMKSAFLFFEILIWSGFEFVGLLEEWGIKSLAAVLLIAVGTMGITLYDFRLTLIDVFGVFMSGFLGIYGFVYLGYLVRIKKHPEEEKS